MKLIKNVKNNILVQYKILRTEIEYLLLVFNLSTSTPITKIYLLYLILEVVIYNIRILVYNNIVDSYL